MLHSTDGEGDCVGVGDLLGFGQLGGDTQRGVAGAAAGARWAVFDATGRGANS